MSERTAPTVANLKLRFADETDVETILGLIRGLADYERLSHEVTADATTLRRSLFGARPAAEVVIAEVDGTPVGFALFFHSFSTFLGLPGIYIEDLYIEPAWREEGIGRALLSHVARLAKERGCGRLEWAVLDWNAPAISFYKKLGARPLEDWTIFRVTGIPLDELSLQSTDASNVD
jgi:GNAT superfamily N-acetyltransferase